jgi:hydroxyacylglutathione hydrolase
MLDVRQLRYSPDNLGYLVCAGKTAIAIDGGAVDAIIAFLEETHRSLRYATVTHSHPDHTVGLDRLASITGAQVIDSFKLARGEGGIDLEGETIKVLPTPGHSLDSVVFAFDTTLITGDTLFNGTVGNCFTGDLKGFYQSIKKLLAFPETFRVYAGHDYVAESVALARTLEPDNPVLDRFIAAYNPHHVVSTLAEERAMNPFLRFNEPAMINILQAKGLPVGTEFERWCSVMTL